MSLREHTFFQDCEQKLVEACRKRWGEEALGMTAFKKKASAKRLNTELKAICDCGYAELFWLLAALLQELRQWRRLAVAGGLAAYSYAAYLLGIAELDPIDLHYPAELLFSDRMNKAPYMVLYTAEGCREQVTEYLHRIFGEDIVAEKSHAVVIGKAKDDPREETADVICLPLFESNLLTEAETVMARQGGMATDASFQKEREHAFSPVRMAEEYSNERMENRKKILYSYATAHEHPYDRITAQWSEFCSAVTGNNTFWDIVNVVAAIRGTGVWKSGSAEYPLFFTRDHVYQYGMVRFQENKAKAYQLMDAVCKGRGGTPRIQKLLQDNGADEEVCESVKRIRYLACEGECALAAYLICYLAEVREK